jgi:histidinol-phosphate phosphatase family protein
LRGALFLDRDGTIIVDRHYIGNPAEVSLIHGAAEAIREANARAIPVIVITNQSGIGRGLITLEQYHAVHQRMTTLLGEHGATIDASYYCPHWPDSDGPCECRKPGLALYRQAASEHGLDLAHSGYIGDRLRDIEPGVKSGGFGVLVPGDNTPAGDVDAAREIANVSRSIGEAVGLAIAYIYNLASSVRTQSAGTRQ